MRMRQHCADHELELQIIHETELELVFRLGNLNQLDAIKNARQKWTANTWALGFYSGMIVISYLVVFYFYPSLMHDINIKYGIYYAFTIGLPIIIFLYIIYALYVFYKPCSIAWYLDKNTKKLIRVKTNLLGKKRQIAFDFDQIKSIQVTQEHDEGSFECAELYLVLQSGKEMTLSQSSYDLKPENKAIDLTYHQEIAAKMRSFIGII